MWMHVADERLLDVVLGTAVPRDREHVAGCARCRSRVEEATGGLAAAVRTAAPEPSPLYFDHFRARLASRLDAAPAPAPARPRFLAPALLAAAAVVAGIALFPMGTVQAPLPPAAPTLAAWSALPAQDDDDGLAVLEELQAEPQDLAGAGACTEVNACLVSMSDEESRALADLLRDELAGGKKL